MNIFQNSNMIKSISFLLLFSFCFIILVPAPAQSSSQAMDAVKKEVGIIINDMINDSLTPDRETRKVLKILLSGSKLKESQVKIYKNKFLNQLHDQIIASLEPEDNDPFHKKTTTIIAVLMLLAAEEYDNGIGYLDLAGRYFLGNMSGDGVVAECHCALIAVQYYIEIKSRRSDLPPSEGLLTGYKDSINSVKTEYKTARCNSERDEAEFRFDKHHSKIIAIMEKAAK